MSCIDQRAIVSPWGASLRRYFFIDESGQEPDSVSGYSGASRQQSGQDDVLIPFSGRISNGRSSFDGRSFQLECNDKEGPNAIHGFVLDLPWHVQKADSNNATCEIRLNAATHARQSFPFTNHRGDVCSHPLPGLPACSR
jgi:aldose 1-epimerase